MNLSLVPIRQRIVVFGLKLLCGILGHRWGGWLEVGHDNHYTRQCLRCRKLEVKMLIPPPEGLRAI